VPQCPIRRGLDAAHRTGANWTVSLRSVEPRALFEASDIVADIQEAYELAIAA
jgi:hypothetical protein